MEPDVAVGFMHSVFVPLGVALARTGIPLIASEHTSIEHYGRSRVQRLLLELAPLLSVAGTIPSDRVRHDYPHRLRRRMWVIPNPVSSRPTAARRSRGNVVLAVGRLSAEKNHGELIRAFERDALRFRDWQLRIIGDGVLRSDLECQVQKSGLEHQVVLPGATDDVAAEYAGAAFVVVPSRYESFGLVTAEALAAGRAVIGFADCPGTNELIEHGVNGLLVDGSGDRVSTLAAGLERMMADDELRQRMGTAGPASVSAFDLNAVVDRWEDLLLRCASLRH
jgi:GalNAc-alpha-(1->4)-GalNAc-alpha-(1->3)-diNAcBac-PP-undecaprenol alpha-1,4-N-acetyl-D-galactosaminyltransferase